MLRIAIVNGGTRGIGRAIYERLKREGSEVAGFVTGATLAPHGGH